MPGAEQSGDWTSQLGELFDRRRPAILARIESLAGLADAAEPTAEELEAGRVEAHKLHGLLGTIGLPEGSEVAAEIEGRLAAGVGEISGLVTQLRELVVSHAA